MITREEEIINVARKYVDGCTLSSPSDVLHFEAGAKWSDEHPKNVWHDASEKPDFKKSTLYELANAGKPPHYTVMKYYTADDIDIGADVTRWAYIEDLLPKGR